MSVIGPRPLLVEYLPYYTKYITERKNMIACKCHHEGQKAAADPNERKDDLDNVTVFVKTQLCRSV